MTEKILIALLLAATAVGIVLILQLERVLPIRPEVVETHSLAIPMEEVTVSHYPYIRRVMNRCGTHIPEETQNRLASQISTAIDEVFAPEEQIAARAYVALLCIESRFDNSARSPVGAVGIAQVMPGNAPEFAALCGMDATDVYSLEVNVRMGACFFRSLVHQFDGNIALALAAYNSGPSSSTTRRLATLDVGAQETSGYLAKNFVLLQEMGK
jgi:hypothetical protein